MIFLKRDHLGWALHFHLLLKHIHLLYHRFRAQCHLRGVLQTGELLPKILRHVGNLHDWMLIQM